MPPYQGARAHIADTQSHRVFAVSKVGLDASGQVANVLWAEVNAKSNLGVSDGVRAPASEVVDAIHAGHRVIALFPTTQTHLPECMFVVIDHPNGHETIALDGPPAAGRGVLDMAPLNA